MRQRRARLLVRLRCLFACVLFSLALLPHAAAAEPPPETRAVAALVAHAAGTGAALSARAVVALPASPIGREPRARRARPRARVAVATACSGSRLYLEHCALLR